jgi:hypothetical protein
VSAPDADEDVLAHCMGAWKALYHVLELQPAVLQSSAHVTRDAVSRMFQYFVLPVSPFIQQCALEVLLMVVRKYFDVARSVEDTAVLAVNRLTHLFVLLREHPDGGQCPGVQRLFGCCCDIPVGFCASGGSHEAPGPLASLFGAVAALAKSSIVLRRLLFRAGTLLYSFHALVGTGGVRCCRDGFDMTFSAAGVLWCLCVCAGSFRSHRG